MIRPILLALLSLLISSTSQAQLSDTLYGDIQNSMSIKDRQHLTDAERLDLLWNTGVEATHIHYDEMLPFARAYQQEFPTLAPSRRKMNLAMSLGFFFGNAGSFDTASVYWKSALDLSRNDTSYQQEMRMVYTNLANNYAEHYQADSAIALLHSAMDRYGQLNDSDFLYNAYTAYEMLYTKMRVPEVALQYSRRSLDVMSRRLLWGHDYTVAVVFLADRYSTVAQNTGKGSYMDTARSLTMEVMERTKNRPEAYYGICYYELGIIEYCNGRYQEAIRYFDTSLLPRYTENSLVDDLSSNVNLYRAICKTRLGMREGAEDLQKLDLPPNAFGIQKKINEALYLYSKGQGDWKNALHYHEEFLRMSDSSAELANRGKVFQAEQEYNYALHEKDNAVLRTKNVLATAQRNRIIAGSVISILALAVLLLLFVMRNRRLKTEKAIAAQQLATERGKLMDDLHALEREMQQESIRQRAAAEAAMTGQRRDIGQNLHDELATSLAALRYLIGDMRMQAPTEHERKVLEDIEDEAKHVYIQSREFMHRLSADGEAAEHQNVFELLSNLEMRFNTGSNLEIVVNADGSLKEQVSQRQNSELYKVVKEAVANCMKHSGASRMDIRIYRDMNELHFDIYDNGQGMTASAAGSGMGMETMQQRIESLHGSLRVMPTRTGMKISGSFPMDEPVEEA